VKYASVFLEDGKALQETDRLVPSLIPKEGEWGLRRATRYIEWHRQNMERHCRLSRYLS